MEEEAIVVRAETVDALSRIISKLHTLVRVTVLFCHTVCPYCFY